MEVGVGVAPAGGASLGGRRVWGVHPAQAGTRNMGPGEGGERGERGVGGNGLKEG